MSIDPRSDDPRMVLLLRQIAHRLSRFAPDSARFTPARRSPQMVTAHWRAVDVMRAPMITAV